jgi:hypothetical protein
MYVIVQTCEGDAVRVVGPYEVEKTALADMESMWDHICDVENLFILEVEDYEDWVT